MRERQRNNLIAAIIGLVLLSIVVIGILMFVRSQNENREKNLKITPTYTGRPTDNNQ